MASPVSYLDAVPDRWTKI